MGEKEFLELIPSTKEEDFDYLGYIDISRTLIKELKEVDKCDYVIALTHMRIP